MSDKRIDIDCQSIEQLLRLKPFEQRIVKKSFEVGDYLVSQGDSFLYLPIVKLGVVRLDCTSIVKDVLLDYVVAGEVCMVSFSHYNAMDKLLFAAQALTRVEAWLLPRDIISELLEKDRDFVGSLLNRLSFEFQHILQLYIGLQNDDLEKRLERYLQKYSRKLELNGVKLTHQQIAIDLGVSRESVSRIMSKKGNL
ncbi:Crp/Fnr family transcriptional regulator [Flavobacterium columnare]|uniref:Crp/Fnr family transcriptional regulator n=1 Tax=Flavobacterium columnare TaxID=996 RepID=UPI0040342205